MMNSITTVPVEIFEPSPKQEELIKSLVDMTDDRSYFDKAISMGVPSETLHNWMYDKNFVNYLNSKLPIVTDALEPKVWQKLNEHIDKGSLKSLELYFRLKGKMEQRPPIAQQFNFFTDKELKMKVEDLGIKLPTSVQNRLESINADSDKKSD